MGRNQQTSPSLLDIVQSAKTMKELQEALDQYEMTHVDSEVTCPVALNDAILNADQTRKHHTSAVYKMGKWLVFTIATVLLWTALASVHVVPVTPIEVTMIASGLIWGMVMVYSKPIVDLYNQIYQWVVLFLVQYMHWRV